MTLPDVLVIGGGVIGSSVAYHLARDGVAVELVERGGLAEQASGAAAGMLLPIGEASGEGAFLSLGLRALAGMPELADALHELSGIDPEHEPSGALHLAFDAEHAEALRAAAQVGRATGLVLLDADETRKRVPSVGPDVVAGLWSPREAHVRSPRLGQAYAGAAEHLGARLRLGEAVLGIRVQDGRVQGVDTSAGFCGAGAVVLCAGAWSTRLAAEAIGVALPIEPVRGQIVSLVRPEELGPEILATDDVYLVPKRDGTLVVGATVEHVGFDASVTAEGVAGLLGAAIAKLPGLADAAFTMAWAGLRPTTPDGLPLVGALPGVEGLFVAAGHSRNGVLLSGVTGQLVADQLAGRPASRFAEVLAPERF